MQQGACFGWKASEHGWVCVCLFGFCKPMGNCFQKAVWAHLSPKDRDALVQRKKSDLVPRIRHQRRIVSKNRSRESALETSSRERLKKLMGTAYVTKEAIELEAAKCCAHAARKQQYARVGIQLEAMEAGVDQWSITTDRDTVMLKVLADTEGGLAVPEAKQRLPDIVARLENAMREGGFAETQAPCAQDAGTGMSCGDGPLSERDRDRDRDRDRASGRVHGRAHGRARGRGRERGRGRPRASESGRGRWKHVVLREEDEYADDDGDDMDTVSRTGSGSGLELVSVVPRPAEENAQDPAVASLLQQICEEMRLRGQHIAEPCVTAFMGNP